jgi:hypothetical protein
LPQLYEMHSRVYGGNTMYEMYFLKTSCASFSC